MATESSLHAESQGQGSYTSRTQVCDGEGKMRQIKIRHLLMQVTSVHGQVCVVLCVGCALLRLFSVTHMHWICTQGCEADVHHSTSNVGETTQQKT